MFSSNINSLVFNTISNDINGANKQLLSFSNQFGILGRSLADLKNAYIADGVGGFFNSISSSLTKRDIDYLENYNNLIASGVDSQSAFNRTMLAGSRAAQDLALGANGAKVQTQGLTVATTGTKVAMIGAKVAAVALNAALSYGIAFVIQLAVEAFQNLSNSADDFSEKAQEASESAKEFKQSIDDLDDYQEKINELTEELKSNNITFETAKQKREELLSIQDELIKKYGYEKEVIEAITGALSGEADALDRVRIAAAFDYNTDHKDEINNAQKYMNTYTTESEGGVSLSGTPSSIIEQAEQQINAIQNILKNENLSEDQKAQYNDTYTKLSKILSRVRKTYDDNKNLLDLAVENALIYDDDYREKYTEYKAAIDEYNDAVLSGNEKTQEVAFEKQKAAYKDFVNSITYDSAGVDTTLIKKYVIGLQDSFNQTLDDYPLILHLKTQIQTDGSYVSQIMDAMDSEELGIADLANLSEDSVTYKKIREAVLSYNNNAIIKGDQQISIDDYIESLVSLIDVQKQTAESGEELANSFSLTADQAEQLEDIDNDISKLQTAYDKLQDGTLKTDDVNELVKLFPELAQYVDYSAENFGNLAEGIMAVAKARPEALIDELKTINTDNLSDSERTYLSSLISMLQSMSVTATNSANYLNEVVEAFKGVSDSIGELQDFADELSSDGALSASSIKTIMEDDTYISLRPLINDSEALSAAITELSAAQKDAYEDLYNEQIRLQDPDAYHEAVVQKEAENENYLSNSIASIEAEVKAIEEQYDVDLSNWNNLSESKKAMLENTNAKLLSEQISLINEFKNKYGIDLSNYKTTTEAKAAIAETYYAKLKVLESNYQKYLDESKYTVGYENGQLYLIKYDEKDNEWHRVDSTHYQKVVSDYNQAYSDYYDVLNGNGKFSGLENDLDKILKAYNFTDTTWNGVTGGSGSSGSSSSSSSSEYKDWIERSIAYYNDKTTKSYAKVSKYSNYKDKNNQLYLTISDTKDEIFANNAGYNQYMKAANQVGLDAYYAQKVREGSINVEEITDSTLKDKISRYQDLYDKAQDCLDSADSLIAKLEDYATEILTNINNYYSNNKSIEAANATYYDSLDTDNLYLGKNYGAIRESYNKQIEYEQNRGKELQSTLNSLVSQGLIKRGSDEWYEWTEEIKNSANEVRNLQKNVRDLADEELSRLSTDWSNKITATQRTRSGYETAASDTTRNISKNYSAIKNTYSNEITQTEKEAAALQERLDKALSNKEIEKYSDKWYEWTETIAKTNEEVVTLRKNLHELAVESFNAIKTNYDNSVSIYDQQAKEYDYANQEIEAKGYISSIKAYELMQQNASNKLKVTQQYAKDLENSLTKAINSGDIEVGSQAWYDMRDAINEANNAVKEGQIEILNYSKTIRSMQWEYFEYIQDRISKINDEANFFIDLMKNSKLFNDNGQITDKGKATLGLRAENYNIYMNQADMYAEEIKKVNKELAKDPNNKELIEHRQELLKLQRQSITSAESEKQAIKSLIKDGYDLQLNYLKELIDKYEESLDSAKTLYDYQKNIDSKTSNIANLQKQIKAYELDTSEETVAKLQKLQVELKDAEKDLEQTEYEKLISDTKSLLSDLYDDYEETLNSKLDDIDALILDVVNAVNDGKGDIRNAIQQQANDVGYAITKDLDAIWYNSNQAVEKYGSDFTKKLTTINDTLRQIGDNTTQLINAADNIVQQNSNDAQEAKTARTSGTTYGTFNTNSNSTGIRRYKSGGLVNYTGLAQVDGTPLKPEAFLDAEDTANISSLTNVLDILSKRNAFVNNNFTPYAIRDMVSANMANIAQIQNGSLRNYVNDSNVSFGDIVISIDKVDDYKDFLAKIKTDKSFENIIKDMTVSRLSGGLYLSKYKH